MRITKLEICLACVGDETNLSNYMDFIIPFLKLISHLKIDGFEDDMSVGERLDSGSVSHHKDPVFIQAWDIGFCSWLA